jgi:hypothetical protein
VFSRLDEVGHLRVTRIAIPLGNSWSRRIPATGNSTYTIQLTTDRNNTNVINRVKKQKFVSAKFKRPT